MNSKGFAISSMLYLILVMAIVLISLTLALLSSRKLILDKAKVEATDEIYNTYSASYQKVLNNLQVSALLYAKTDIINTTTSIKISDLNNIYVTYPNEVLTSYELNDKYLTVVNDLTVYIGEEGNLYLKQLN